MWLRASTKEEKPRPTGSQRCNGGKSLPYVYVYHTGIPDASWKDPCREDSCRLKTCCRYMHPSNVTYFIESFRFSSLVSWHSFPLVASLEAFICVSTNSSKDHIS